MKLIFKKLNLLFIFLILICSFIIVFCPLGKSGPFDQIYECNPDIIIEYDEELVRDPIIPYNETRTIPVTINARIVGPAADIVVEKIGQQGQKVKLIVDLSIETIDEGITASIAPPIIQFPVSEVFVPQNASISITVNKNLPAGQQKDVIVRMNTRKLGVTATLVNKVNITQEIPFIIGYYPRISFIYRDGNVRNINPEETASFNFEIQNWGNSATNVFSEVVGLPEGWSAEIVRNTTLGSELTNSTNKKTISFRVKSPIDFGYHEDRAIIKVAIIPKSIITSEVIGKTHYLYFIIQSQGFSTPGFETSILFVALILIFLPFAMKKKRKKEKNQQGGKR